ncbi:MAG TPA: GNAT family protein [Phenylobacterium sp.]|jgi:RimJ/RimL family protein N-acetyltransferase|uniref:GNAT family N-acetyltransferase n=1 Tax=Phenylobacterium sp. TaxID=1871053 RepID=UPI002CFA6A3C|nr:GNAT family protein [Phenylobacterium sp.]HXA38332.1 GNAT family protein [Phenylobacterium sp.]
MILAQGKLVRLRTIRIPDLKAATAHAFSLSATEPMTDLAWARAVHDQTGFWTPKTGVAAFEVEDRLVGTMQYYPPGPRVHGFEIGYSLHNEDDRGKGYGSEALRLFSDLLFAQHPECHRLQLIIAVENFADARTVEHCGYAAEGTLRKAHYTGPGEPADCLVYSRVRD